jgi:phosphate uptake regulator
MDTQEQNESVRSQLFRMSRLSQRAVDYSIKGYELGRPEFCREVYSAEKELRNLRHGIAERGRMALAGRMPIGTDTRFACCALRICNALHSTYNAAAAIAHDTERGLGGERKLESSIIGEMGQFVNSLVRLYTVALFNEELQLANTVLQSDKGGRWFNLTLRQTQSDLVYRTGPRAELQLAILENLAHIAEQSYEVAHAIAIWLEGKDCLSTTRESAPYFMRRSLPMNKTEQAGAA